jgi:membrane-associated phospholipid phosphatase
MTNKSYSPVYKALFALTLVFALACNKDFPVTDPGDFERASIDETGGTWARFVATDADALDVPTPAATNSSSYQAELAELRNTIQNRTAEQEAIVRYWSAGAAYRWNEIARELAAKYNLPPAANLDGTYPVPDAANPFNYPKFPFANPPYAARMFGYLGVAQYDALVTAWKVKYQHKRPAPYTVDASINCLVSKSILPAYPSEDAVVAGASLVVLKAMFPCEVDFLHAKAEEHRQARLWAGANVRSDVEAGASLGERVGNLALARSRADGMRTANNQAAFPEIVAAARSKRLGATWESLESPARPPMLPMFGNLKTWNFDPEQVIALRPAAPPAVGSEDYNKAMTELLGFAKNLSRDQHRIANYWADGPGSYTPPGHWNRIAGDLFRQYRWSELRAARGFALVGTALMDAGITCWDVKYFYCYPRPFQIDNTIRTVVGVPNFPAYTSGHSTFSAAAAAVLGYLLPSEKGAMEALAKEASESRIYGCIHYRFDCEVGLEAGRKVGEYAIAKGRADRSPQ